MSERQAAAPPQAGGTGDGGGAQERAANGSRTTDLPRYPERDAPIERGGRTAGRPPWVLILVMVVGALLLLVFFALHLSGGLGPGLHGGG